MEKNYKLNSTQIERLIPDIGFALATDMITVAGKRVDYMVREQPNREDDSGWIFYGGGETQEYIDDSNNTSLFSVNTIANYDPEIIGFLTYPPGTEVERNSEGDLQVITEGLIEPEVIFMPPIDKGFVKVTNNWSFNVSSRMLKRFDKGSLVIWRPGFTIWLDSYDTNDSGVSARVESILDTISPKKIDFINVSQNGMQKIRYRLKEATDGKKQDAIYLFAVTESHEIRMAVYFDNQQDISEIVKIWDTLQYSDS